MTSSIDPIADLWQSARAWFAQLTLRFGAPAKLAREACAALKRELAALRSVVLKLLLVEAALLPRSVAHASRAAMHATAPTCRVDDAARPETWNVRFSLRLPSAPKRRRRSINAVSKPRREPEPHELARAHEALRRVLNDPAPFAARLARRLHALGAEACAAARRIASYRPHFVPAARTPLHARAWICAHEHLSRFRGAG